MGGWDGAGGGLGGEVRWRIDGEGATNAGGLGGGDGMGGDMTVESADVHGGRLGELERNGE